MAIDEKKRAFGFAEFARMFSVSVDSVKRLWKSGDLVTITIGGRRLIPASEIERVEREGVGTPRKRNVRVTRKAGDGFNVD